MSEYDRLKAQKDAMLAAQDHLTVADGNYLRERLVEAAGQEQTIKVLRAEIERLSKGYHESCFAREDALRADAAALKKAYLDTNEHYVDMMMERDAALAALRELKSLCDALAALLAEVEAPGVLIDGNVFVNYDLKDRIRAALKDRSAPRQASNAKAQPADA